MVIFGHDISLHRGVAPSVRPIRFEKIKREKIVEKRIVKN
jgi:hypothetical protein